MFRSTKQCALDLTTSKQQTLTSTTSLSKHKGSSLGTVMEQVSWNHFVITSVCNIEFHPTLCLLCIKGTGFHIPVTRICPRKNCPQFAEETKKKLLQTEHVHNPLKHTHTHSTSCLSPLLVSLNKHTHTHTLPAAIHHYRYLSTQTHTQQQPLFTTGQHQQTHKLSGASHPYWYSSAHTHTPVTVYHWSTSRHTASCLSPLLVFISTHTHTHTPATSLHHNTQLVYFLTAGVFSSTQELQCGTSSLVEVLGGDVWPGGRKSSGEPGVSLSGA